MSQFTALNVEPDDTQQDDVDNAREYQLEEALKLYQIALKLHSQVWQGPEVFTQAVEAYTKLLDHEVFRFPDSMTEFERFEIFGDADTVLHRDMETAVIQPSDTTNSLPQVLYLAYKNHGLLLMDLLKYRHLSGEAAEAADVRRVASHALDNFAKALSRDESDTELWRRAARVASIAGSQRIARYCLEAALEVDDDPTEAQVEPVTLEEGFAGALLQEHLEVLEDEVALSHPIMAPYQHNALPECAKPYLDPYPFLPQSYPLDESPAISSVRLEVELSDRSWQALGASLLQANMTNLGSSRAVNLSVAARDEEMIDADATVDSFGQQALMGERQLDAKPSYGDENSEIEVGDQQRAQHTEHVIQDSSRAEIEDIVMASGNDEDKKSAELHRKQDDDSGDRSRKRSISAVKDGVEDDSMAHKRSKRIRNRDTIGTEGLPVDPLAVFQDRLLYYKEADILMFNYINSLLTKLHLPELGSVEALHTATEINTSQLKPRSPRETLIGDLRAIFEQWNDVHATSYTKGNAANLLLPAAVPSGAGLSTLLEHLTSSTIVDGSFNRAEPGDRIPEFVAEVNTGWMPLQDVVFNYFQGIEQTYTSNTWSEETKFNTLQLLVQCDEALYGRIIEILADDESSTSSVSRLGQMLFELHLDLYIQIMAPNSGVADTIVTDQQQRLPRWAVLATEVAHFHNDIELTMRYLWSSALFIGSCPEAKERSEHIIASWHDMKHSLDEADISSIKIANNSAMPEISSVAANRHITKISSTDFFNRLISSDSKDPVALIETLEPVLMPGLYQREAQNNIETNGDSPSDKETIPAVQVSENLQNIWRLMEEANAAIHLFLWQRLREAYQHSTVNYKTKVFSCHLKSIEVIVGDLMTPAFCQHSQATRQNAVLGWLKTLDDLLVKSLTMALNDNTAFDIIDEQHTISTCAALVELCLLLHSAAIYDDHIRIGAVIPKIKHGQKAWDQLWHRLREMQIRAWALLYTLLKDAMLQSKEVFANPDGDLADCLSVIHVQLGSRKQCKVSNKIFLKMMKVEMLRFKDVDKWSDYMGQVLYDLYGLKLGTGIYVLGEHDCPTENLERRTAMQISEKIIQLANSMSVKDLLKSELRLTIEAMQKAISNHKPEHIPSIKYNERLVKNYLKGSLSPKDLTNAIKGLLSINTVPIHESSDSKSSERILGQIKWYFLIGVMALTRFKTQKRLVPGAATDDLRVALSYLHTQIYHTSNHWEAWYRLGQCFDAELEENVMFSADKLNNPEDRKDIARYQRQAIRCYTLCYSVALQHADDSRKTAGVLGDMYHDFAMRLYSSSREPFVMEAFYLDDFPRHFCGREGAMYTDHAHPEFKRAQVWRYASFLFKKAIVDKPTYWFNYYMNGKCLWKLFTKDSHSRDRPLPEEFLHALEMAIRHCPKTSSSTKDPLLEPHYKYMSIMHKLVLRGQISLQDAADKIQNQRFTYNRGAKVTIETFDEWKDFILDRIRAVQHADKSSWHHRIIFRLARIIHDEQTVDVVTAREAYACLMKAMFTKTMVVNVWKPEYERLGRHCVYGEDYIRYMVHLLLILDEREQMLQLCRRVRKRQADYYHFQQLWETCIEGACALFRRAIADVPTDTKDVLLEMEPEAFRTIANRLKEQVESDATILPPSAALYKDIDELKRLNNTTQGASSALVKTTLMDDLIIDIYSAIFKDVGMALSPSAPEVQMASPPPTGAIVVKTSSVPEPRPAGPMSITSMLAKVPSPEPAPSPLEQSAPPSLDILSGSVVPSIEKETVVRPPKPLIKRELLKRGELLLKGLNLPLPQPAAAKSKTTAPEPKDGNNVSGTAPDTPGEMLNVDYATVDDEPVNEGPAGEGPIDYAVGDEEPVDEDPADDEPADDELVDDQPVDQEPEDDDDDFSQWAPDIIGESRRILEEVPVEEEDAAFKALEEDGPSPPPIRDVVSRREERNDRQKVDLVQGRASDPLSQRHEDDMPITPMDEEQRPADSNDEESEMGSLHDSADDESDGSDDGDGGDGGEGGWNRDMFGNVIG